MVARLELSERFLKRVRSLDRDGREAVVAAVERFEADPRHPSLHFKRLVGSDAHTIRATRSIRLVLRPISADAFVAVDVGTHDVIRRY